MHEQTPLQIGVTLLQVITFLKASESQKVIVLNSIPECYCRFAPSHLTAYMSYLIKSYVRDTLKCCPSTELKLIWYFESEDFSDFSKRMLKVHIFAQLLESSWSRFQRKNSLDDDGKSKCVKIYRGYQKKKQTVEYVTVKLPPPL